MRRILPALALLLVAGCTFKSVSHDSKTAAVASNLFLKAMYVDHDYNRALALAYPEMAKKVTAENLAQLVDMVEKNCGVRQEFKAESYQLVPGQGLELFYVEKCDKTTLYHRTVLLGNVQEGYRVAGVWFQSQPFTGTATQHKFDKEIFVQ
jgi:hypothetical protein